MPAGTDSAVQDVVARLQSLINMQARTIERQARELVHNRKIFDRAAAAAKMGVWECTLDDEMLHWSDGVYDIFDLPRGASITREQIMGCYSAASRAEMQALRQAAIEACSGFTAEIEITTIAGNHRWIRLTATVEAVDGVPVRIFGIKQDITDEKQLFDRIRYLAEFDQLTGLANRSQFQGCLRDVDNRAPGAQTISALLLIDIDKFKEINDTFGHIGGDQCLVETAHRLTAVCGDADLVARLGGDEFAVLLGPGYTIDRIERLGDRLLHAFAERFQSGHQTMQISVSIGAASFVDRRTAPRRRRGAWPAVGAGGSDYDLCGAGIARPAA